MCTSLMIGSYFQTNKLILIFARKSANSIILTFKTELVLFQSVQGQKQIIMAIKTTFFVFTLFLIIGLSESWSSPGNTYNLGYYHVIWNWK